MQTTDVFPLHFPFIVLLLCQTGELLSADTAVTSAVSGVERRFKQPSLVQTEPVFQ